jgi:hypothetical protein
VLDQRGKDVLLDQHSKAVGAAGKLATGNATNLHFLAALGTGDTRGLARQFAALVKCWG